MFINPALIQRRVDDTVNFQRNWNEYLTEFGSKEGNYWAGLHLINQLTTRHGHLMGLDIHVETFDGAPFTITYDRFYVGDASSNYKLFISGYHTSSDRVKLDPFLESNDTMFTTRDQDNDHWGSGNCAVQSHEGGWWYRDCGKMSLNGNYVGNISNPGVASILMVYIDSIIIDAAHIKTIKVVEMKIWPH